MNRTPHIINALLRKIYSLSLSPGKLRTRTFAGALVAGVFSLGLIGSNANLHIPFSETSVASTAMANNDISHIIFGEATDSDPAAVGQILEKQVKFVSSRPAFFPSLEVVKKHEATIRREARAKNIPEDVALGIAFLENGGAEYAKSPAGAAGIVQLMPGTARDLGLTVNAVRDDRSDPAKSIEAGFRYLANNYKIFGDWGITAWTYHAGEGNGAAAIKAYARANSGINLAGLSKPAQIRSYVQEHKLTVHQLLSDPTVQAEVTNRLNDDSAGYPYKVMAMAHMFQLSKELSAEDFVQKIVMLKANTIKVAELFS